MPVLEITNEMLYGDSVKLLASIIGAHMLWPNPDESAKREEAIKTLKVEWLREQKPGMFKPEWFELAAGAYPLKKIQEWAEEPMKHGTMAGELLACAVGDYLATGSFKFDKDGLKDEIAKTNKRRFQALRVEVGRSTLDKIWKKYKPVAHFWAAYWVNCWEGEEARNFPCHVLRLAEFLSGAQSFLDDGCKATFQQRGGETLLSLGEAWTLPAGLDIPTTDLKFGDRPTG